MADTHSVTAIPVVAGRVIEGCEVTRTFDHSTAVLAREIGLAADYAILNARQRHWHMDAPDAWLRIEIKRI